MVCVCAALETALRWLTGRRPPGTSVDASGLGTAASHDGDELWLEAGRAQQYGRRSSAHMRASRLVRSDAANDDDESSETEEVSDLEKSQVLGGLSPATRTMAAQLQRKPVVRVQYLHNRSTETFHADRLKSRSHLQSLPVEILLSIFGYLPAHMLVSAGFVCSRFRHILALNNNIHDVAQLSSADMDLFKRSFRSLYYCETCLLVQKTKCDLHVPERPILRNASTLHCSGCHAHHGSLLFTEAEQHKANHSRRCIGWNGKFRVDPSTTFTFQDICDLAAAQESDASPQWSKPWYRFDYRLPRQRNLHGAMGSSTGHDTISISVSSSLKATVSQRQPHPIITSLSLCRYGGLWRRTLDHSAILHVLSDGAIEQRTQLCPHQRFDTAAFRRRLSTAESHHAGTATSAAADVAGGTVASATRTPTGPLESSIHRAAADSLAGTGHVRGKTACDECAAYLYLSRDACADSWHGWTFYGIYTQMKNLRPSSYDWLMQLDRASLELSDSAKHLLWCDVASCHTNRAFANRWFEDSPS